MSRKEDSWSTPEDGKTGPGEEFNPGDPEPESSWVRHQPVSHGTPIRRKDYERLKDEAEHGGSPSDENAQVDPSAC